MAKPKAGSEEPLSPSSLVELHPDGQTDERASQSLHERKKALRRLLLQVRHDMGSDMRASVDARIALRLIELPEWQHARMIFSYLSVGEEVDTREIIRLAWEAEKVVAIPRVVPHTHCMDWYRIDDFNNLESSSLGSKLHILEPPADPERFLSVGTEGRVLGRKAILALVPALTFDECGYRVGYGGGFYDRLLAGFLGNVVGLIREAQLTTSLSARGVLEKHDRPVPLVVTEDRIIFGTANCLARSGS